MSIKAQIQREPCKRGPGASPTTGYHNGCRCAECSDGFLTLKRAAYVTKIPREKACRHNYSLISLCPVCGPTVARYVASLRAQGRKPRPLPHQIRAWKSRVVPNESGCWIFTGHLNVDGYAFVTYCVGGLTFKDGLHRIMYEEMREPISEGLVIDHLCRTPACCNPDHLEPVTVAENNRRQVRVAPYEPFGPTLENAEKTHCEQGHYFSERNTFVRGDGSRVCRSCVLVRTRRRRGRPLPTEAELAVYQIGEYVPSRGVREEAS